MNGWSLKLLIAVLKKMLKRLRQRLAAVPLVPIAGAIRRIGVGAQPGG